MAGSFPAGRPAPAAGRAGGVLRRADVELVPAVDGDIPFLRGIYASTRADELSALPWPEAMRAAFVSQQFAAQMGHLLALDSTDHWIVERQAVPVGRLHVGVGGPLWRIAELALSPESRDRGLGTLLVRWVKGAAREAGALGVDLHVARGNQRAAALYARLGFAPAEGGPVTHLRMLWRRRSS